MPRKPTPEPPDGPPKTGPVHVLLLGAGGREHAIGWKLKQAERCGKIWFAPGNGGTREVGTNVDLPFDPVNTKNVDAIDRFCRENGIGLVVIGPEDPLCAGLADRLAAPGRAVFGPVAEAAKLEGDKAWAKDLMRGALIPTADSRTFTRHEPARAYAEARETPVVVKAAGLAKGKGVLVTRSAEEAVAAVDDLMLKKSFGGAGETVIIEERLAGQEVSVLALVDGQNLRVLDPAQDHKAVGEGDTGPNTGGMGAYCPTPVLDEKTLRVIEREVLVRAVDALRRGGVAFRGVLYAGMMLTAGGPKTLEFNTRFGDPETQPLMMRLRGDLLELMLATCAGTLDQVPLDWDPRVCVGVVVCAGGYPGAYRKDDPVGGIDEAEEDPDVKVFHAGTRIDRDGLLVTAGGRVLCVCALADDLATAREKANAAAAKIRFPGAFFRRDIGGRVS
ncbi:phosphoribosylamine--glycine ligase [Phycisphaera mikurensis]|uniref:Phosphoribosylamine--glycine ligase n=1 Tax=Phycisphaera mikurensis (strain NBRC 102666 / KCTC 22515 / FYK2301M01) TaxID=1142394 RepID=I0IB19_PHYMF|nr:phosphoribosylamine--glycine ligase [Phycisphaera mikurensis]MBB6442572.1 phosphoribosylamine--glycine ligase [Phycisphaera mikurensis]BAM02457.1 phosphoribosylamine--glycine ligase [Phycisphaera mikurensis NBRC 102666]